MKINIKNIRVKSICATLFISLLLSCNNSGENAEAENRLTEVLMDVGRSTENAFYSFMSLVSDTLGFRVTKDTTKKEDVGKYFSDLGKKLGETAAELEKVAKKSEVEGATDGPMALAIRSAVDTAKEVLGTLKGHLDSLGTVGDSKPVGDVETSAKKGVSTDDSALKNVYNALKGIVEIAKTQQVKDLISSNVTLKKTSIGVDAKDGAKILGTDQAPGTEVGSKAALIVSAVSGEEMLESIVVSKESDATTGVASNADDGTSALAFAKGGQRDRVGGGSGDAKAAAVAGGIALRSLVKAGTLASNGSDDEKAAQAVGVAAANKLLVAVKDIIKNTVKNVLGTAKQKIDDARKAKPDDNQSIK
ncbi:variable large family protein (plasmid) [Borrelia coriaceae]|uniref:Variable large protein n=1 Tax=Borrelia coriaceae ATCC 43381 TaxID=1408429 RepID=W5SWF5_9SPIR|nr:Variable major outer membrane lipoprotein [Borrelia coriaceae ATCC 43381]UPA17433.1 variable large family protein [Borrelia coriaceae]